MMKELLTGAGAQDSLSVVGGDSSIDSPTEVECGQKPDISIHHHLR
jgi:hypothetical protein